MIQFDAAPPVPAGYARLNALSSDEIARARQAGYVADDVDPAAPVRRSGANNYLDARANDDMFDWRTRMYVIWFCYLYENFELIAKPLYAVEELVLEFQAQSVLDFYGHGLGHLYAGAGAQDPLSASERPKRRLHLRPHYEIALALLDAWNRRWWGLVGTR